MIDVMTKEIDRNGFRNALRRAIEESGLSLLQLSKRAGVAYASIHGFCRNNRDIQLSVASRLGAVVGLELRPTAKRKGR